MDRADSIVRQIVFCSLYAAMTTVMGGVSGETEKSRAAE